MWKKIIDCRGHLVQSAKHHSQVKYLLSHISNQINYIRSAEILSNCLNCCWLIKTVSYEMNLHYYSFFLFCVCVGCRALTCPQLSDIFPNQILLCKFWELLIYNTNVTIATMPRTRYFKFDGLWLYLLPIYVC